MQTIKLGMHLLQAFTIVGLQQQSYMLQGLIACSYTNRISHI